MTIKTVKQFNQEGDKKYKEAVSRFEFGKGGFPFRPMYVFKREDTGEDRKRGYVVSEGNSHHFYLTKAELPKL